PAAPTHRSCGSRNRWRSSCGPELLDPFTHAEASSQFGGDLLLIELGMLRANAATADLAGVIEQLGPGEELLRERLLARVFDLLAAQGADKLRGGFHRRRGTRLRLISSRR